ncbi:MAG: radical SAM protein [Candidatus Kaelpia aquatica]|nr:radical SAM protein [Candidatus Kaelpia aquatica]
MKVALLNMPWKCHGLWGVRAGSRWPHLRHSSNERDYLPYPFFLGYAAALLKENGFNIILVDAIAEQIEVTDFIRTLEKEKPDLIVAETSTPSLGHDLSLAQRIRNIAPVAFCGPEQNIQSIDFFKKNDFIDYILIGEYENILLELATALRDKKSLSEVKGIIYREDGRIVKNCQADLIEDLDTLPWPQREGLFMEHYVDAPGGMPLPSVQMWTSRGCPFKCIFCLWPHVMYHGNSYRTRNAFKVVDEMEYLIKKSGFKSIYIDDDTANVNKVFLMEIAAEIRKRKLRFPWAIMARADLMDKELLFSLRQAGLYSVKYGVESSSQELINNANKNMDLKYTLKMIELTHSLGIKTHLTFTFGLPGETKKTIEKTIALACELNPYSVQFSLTTPFPGTSYFKSLKEKGWSEPSDWSYFDGHKASVVNLTDLSSDNLEISLANAYKIWNQNKVTSLLKKTKIEEVKSFWNCLNLYGTKFALQKKISYLHTKRQLKKIKEDDGQQQAKNNAVLKGILSGHTIYSGPKIVVIDITNKCNLSCIGCWLYSPYLKNINRKRLEEQLSLDTIRDIVDELHKGGVEEIQISGGGEPLMHPNLLEIVEYIKTQKIRLHLVTNFTLFSKRLIDELLRLKLDYITISLWAGDTKTYLKTHPGSNPDMFKKIAINIEYLLKRRKDDRPIVKIYNVISKANYCNIPQMLDFALDRRVDSLEFQLMEPIKDTTEHLAITKKEALIINKMLIQFKDRKDYVPDFISNETIEVFESSSHKNELKDFGRFLNKFKEGFSLTNGVRLARCPSGKYSEKRRTRPPIDIRCIIYYFNQDICKKCKLYQKCYKDDSKTPLEINLLRILGIETFLRRVDSISRECLNLDGEFVDSLPCYVGWYFTRITTNGDVEPCCKAEDLMLGNIKENRFQDIFSSTPYNRFRYNCKNLSKKDGYFSAIDCYKICDNLGMNLNIHKELLDNIKPRNSNYSEVKYHKKNIIIPAKSFKYGNFNRDSNSFGNEIVIDGGVGFGYAKYNIKVSTPGFYEFYIKYASEVPRPVELRIDNEYLSKIAKATTGGWGNKNLKSFKELEYYFDAGVHSIEIYSSRHIPHIDRFELKIKNKKREQYLCDPSTLYSKKDPLRILKESFKTHGVKLTLKRVLKFLKPVNFINSYMDIIGIFDSRYAYKGPFHVQIDLTNNCNNDCIGCWCNSPLLGEEKMPSELKKQYIPLDTLKNILDDVKNMGAKEVYYSGGGEPFMHPDIMEALEYTKRLGLTCYINTNFTLLDKEKIDRLIAIGVDHLTVSIWAGSAKTYSDTHPNKNEKTFYKIKEDLDYLNRNKGRAPLVKLYEVISNINYHEIKEMIDFARTSCCESVEFTLIDTIPGKTDKLSLNKEEREYLYNTCGEIAKELASNFDYKGVHLFRFDQFMRRLSEDKAVREAKYDRNIIDSMPCYIGWLFVRILPDGNINTCLKSHRFPIGNIYEDSFREIWNSPKQIYCREKMLCYKKEDPFFKIIGNDLNAEEAGCYKSCDDIGRNLHMHKKIMSLTKLETFILRLIARYKKREREGIRENLKEINQAQSKDKVIAGIATSRKAFQGPEHVVMDLTNRCQLRCNGCWLYSPYLKENKPSSEWLNKEIPLDSAKSFIKEAIAMGLKTIRFTGGGEPLLYKGVFELIEIAKSDGIKTCITSNFYGLDRERVKKLASLNLDELALSIWAPDPKSYALLHPGAKEEDFLKIKENITLFNSIKANDTKVTIANVISNQNFKKMKEMVDFALETVSDALYFTLIDTLKGETDILLLKEEQLVQLNSDLKSIIFSLGDSRIEIENLSGFIERLSLNNTVGDYDKKRIDRIPCYVGWYFLRILADGSAVPCCRGVDYVMGNINSSSLSDIWYSKEYNGFRHRAKNFKKDHPFFEKMGCYKECDNFMHNEQIHERVNKDR